LKTTQTGLQVTFEQDQLISFRLQAAAFAAAGNEVDYADIRVKVDGRVRSFTLADFLLRLGFQEVA
jgi:hypothetical protein